MLVWGRRANTGLLVSENAGWVCGVGWVLQGGLRWPEPGGTFRLSVQTLVLLGRERSRRESNAPRYRQWKEARSLLAELREVAVPQ